MCPEAVVTPGEHFHLTMMLHWRFTSRSYFRLGPDCSYHRRTASTSFLYFSLRLLIANGACGFMRATIAGASIPGFPLSILGYSFTILLSA